MKVVFTSTGETLEARLDTRFGRAQKFIVYDTEGKTFEVVNNEQNLNAPQGAGIQAAQTVVRMGADCLVTGNCGPKAFRVLSTAGVKVYTTDASLVSQALKEFQAGKLKLTSSANVEGHWS